MTDKATLDRIAFHKSNQKLMREQIESSIHNDKVSEMNYNIGGYYQLREKEQPQGSFNRMIGDANNNISDLSKKGGSLTSIAHNNNMKLLQQRGELLSNRKSNVSSRPLGNSLPKVSDDDIQTGKSSLQLFFSSLTYSSLNNKPTELRNTIRTLQSIGVELTRDELSRYLQECLKFIQSFVDDKFDNIGNTDFDKYKYSLLVSENIDLVFRIYAILVSLDKSFDMPREQRILALRQQSKEILNLKPKELLTDGVKQKFISNGKTLQKLRNKMTDEDLERVKSVEDGFTEDSDDAGEAFDFDGYRREVYAMNGIDQKAQDFIRAQGIEYEGAFLQRVASGEISREDYNLWYDKFVDTDDTLSTIGSLSSSEADDLDDSDYDYESDVDDWLSPRK